MNDFRLPPQNIEFEESILSTCLLSPSELDLIIDTLSPDDFYKKAHGEIYRAIINLYSHDMPVDMMTVIESLKKSDKLESVGGAAYIAGITNSPEVSDSKYYADKLIEAANLRKIIEIATRYQAQCYNGGADDVEAVIDGIQSEVLAIGRTKSKPDFVSVGDLIIPTIERYEELQNRKTELTGVTTGYIDLDSMLCGWQPGDLVIIAARPSMGKTAFAVNSMVRAASKGGRSAIFSLEMAEGQLMNRIMAVLSGVNSTKFRSGRFSDEDWQGITKAAGWLQKYHIYIDDTANQTYQQIVRKARRLKRQENIQSIWIDYLGFIKGDAQKKRVYEIGEISRELKGLAKTLDVPVILLCQLNRQCETRTNKRPVLSDLRESGDLEQDADVVGFIYRDEVYDKSENNPNKGIAEIIIAKQRNGPVGMVQLKWREKTTEFLNYQPEDRI